MVEESARERKTGRNGREKTGREGKGNDRKKERREDAREEEQGELEEERGERVSDAVLVLVCTAYYNVRVLTAVIPVFRRLYKPVEPASKIALGRVRGFCLEKQRQEIDVSVSFIIAVYDEMEKEGDFQQFLAIFRNVGRLHKAHIGGEREHATENVPDRKDILGDAVLCMSSGLWL